MRIITLVLFVFSFAICGQAQVKDVFHQSFEIEELDNIKLNLAGDYEIVYWKGNSVIIETNVELYSASRGIYNFLKEDKGRYRVEADTIANAIHLKSVNQERRPIRNKNKEECFEIIRVRVLVPEDFNVVDQQTLVRIDPDAEKVADPE